MPHRISSHPGPCAVRLSVPSIPEAQARRYQQQLSTARLQEPATGTQFLRRNNGTGDSTTSQTNYPSSSVSLDQVARPLNLTCNVGRNMAQRLKIIRIMVRFPVLTVMIILFCLASISFAANLEGQEKLARELYETMSKTDKWEIDTFIKLHGRVIEQCPDTRRAQESLWRLSNLYLTAKDPPDYQKIIELLEKLLIRYPDSPLVPDAKNRLLMSYEQTGNFRKALTLYDDLFEKNPDISKSDQYPAILLGYAEALAGSSNRVKAKETFRKVIDLKDAEDWLKDIARDRLAEMEKER